MGTQTRILSGIEGTPDGLPFDPTIRIPPIQDPSPLQVISNHRPSPLEPSEGRRPTAVHLTSRSKALASAQPLGGDTPLRPLTGASNTQRSIEDERQAPGPRKRQRVDYVQLPKPQKPASIGRNSSLDLIPRVNQLHEPPPSAARFPPITTNTVSPVIQRAESLPSRFRHSSTGSRRRPKYSEKAEATVPGPEVSKPKRNYTRGRRMWNDKETGNLLKGVAKYGVGKWKRIIEDPEFDFSSDRTAVDLKDRYRTCRMHEERCIDQHASGDPVADEILLKCATGAGKRRKKTAQKEGSPPESITTTTPRREGPAESVIKNTKLENPEISFALVNTIQDMAEALNTSDKPESINKKWTPEEDSNLSKGFQKHGFHWTAISKDPELYLQHKSGPQLRDRFRIKFPIHYQSSVPVALPDPPKPRVRIHTKNRTKSESSSWAASTEADQRSQPETSVRENDKTEQRSNSMRIADIVKPTDNHSPAPGPTFKPSLPSMQSLCAQVDAQPLPEPLSYGELDVQPLPEAGEDFGEESDYESGSDLDMQNHAQMDEESGNESDGSAQAAEDVRHLSILGLLNESDQEITRLPPFKSTYDDTIEDWGQDSVTLPPLLWEAMAPRPMFDLE